MNQTQRTFLTNAIQSRYNDEKKALGSDKALSALIDQADKLCSMYLTASSQLLISNGN